MPRHNGQTWRPTGASVDPDQPRARATAQIAAGICGTLSAGTNNTSQESHDRSTRTPASQLVVTISTTPPRSRYFSDLGWQSSPGDGVGRSRCVPIDGLLTKPTRARHAGSPIMVNDRSGTDSEGRFPTEPPPRPVRAPQPDRPVT